MADIVVVMPIISLDHLHLVLELMSNRYQNSLKLIVLTIEKNSV